MNIRCPLCSQSIIIESEIVEGQNVQCPYCNGKFAYQSEAETVRVKRNVGGQSVRREEPSVKRMNIRGKIWAHFKMFIGSVLWLGWLGHIFILVDGGSFADKQLKTLFEIKTILLFIAAFLFSKLCVED